MREPRPTRRTFVTGSAAALAAAAAPLDLIANAHAAGSDTLRVGLVGCGGRGTGAAEQALTADKNTRLVALDVLEEVLERTDAPTT